MSAISQDNYVVVTFETLLDQQGVLDPAHYVLRPLDGGVPIMVRAVTLVEPVTAMLAEVLPSASFMFGSSSLSAAGMLIFPPAHMEGGSELAGEAHVRSSVIQVRLEINKPTKGRTYIVQVSGLMEFLGGAPYGGAWTFEALSSSPTVTAVEQFDEGQ